MHSSDATLVRMANQIAMFFRAQGEERAVAGIADHIRKFWEPRMRTAAFALVEKPDAGFEPLALKAIEQLKRAAPAAAAEPAAKPAKAADAAKAKAKSKKAPAH